MAKMNCTCGGRVKLGVSYVYLAQGLESSCLGYTLHHGPIEGKRTGMSLLAFHLNAPRHNSSETFNIAIIYSIIKHKATVLRVREKEFSSQTSHTNFF